jgi:hypothetical protein
VFGMATQEGLACGQRQHRDPPVHTARLPSAFPTGLNDRAELASRISCRLRRASSYEKAPSDPEVPAAEVPPAEVTTAEVTTAVVPAAGIAAVGRIVLAENEGGVRAPRRAGTR